MIKSVSILVAAIVVLFAVSSIADNQVVVIPLPSGSSSPGVALNQSCPGRSVMTGIKADGSINCSKKIVFVSSLKIDGDFSEFGISHIKYADDHCTSLANAVGYEGKFKAWLSVNTIAQGGTSSPATSFYQHPFGYQLVDGTVVADSWEELTSGTLKAPIHMTEQGDVAPTLCIGGVDCFWQVWTNTNTAGTSFSQVSNITCDGWSDNSAGFAGVVGNPASTSSEWTIKSGIAQTVNCDTFQRLYCFEQ